MDHLPTAVALLVGVGITEPHRFCFAAAIACLKEATGQNNAVAINLCLHFLGGEFRSRSCARCVRLYALQHLRFVFSPAIPVADREFISEIRAIASASCFS